MTKSQFELANNLQTAHIEIYIHIRSFVVLTYVHFSIKYSKIYIDLYIARTLAIRIYITRLFASHALIALHTLAPYTRSHICTEGTQLGHTNPSKSSSKDRAY